MKDKFWNFIFYKFIFVFGIVNVQYLHEIVLWVGWFTAIGFLHLMAQLCKDRFEYVSTNVNSWTELCTFMHMSHLSLKKLHLIFVREKKVHWIERRQASIRQCQEFRMVAKAAATRNKQKKWKHVHSTDLKKETGLQMDDIFRKSKRED